MRINPDIFRAYDIRGIYPSTLNEDVAYLTGRAFVKFLKRKNLKIVVGRDGRLSSPLLFKALIKGITDQGADVIDIGLSITPMLYFGVAHYGFDGGAEVTASVDGSEFTLIKEIGSQKQFLVRIGEFIDFLIEKRGKPQKFAILSFNPHTGKVQFKTIKNVFRHPLKEKLYQLVLKYGRRIKVTEFHSVYTLRNNEVISIPTKDLKKNDLVAVPNFLPNTSSLSPIDLAKELYHFRKQLREIFLSGPEIKKILLKRYFNSLARKKRISLSEKGRKILRQRREEMKLSRRECAEIYNLSSMTIQRIELGNTRKFVKEEYLKRYIKALGFHPVEKFLSRFTLEKRNFFGNWKGGRAFQTLKFIEISEGELQEINDCQLHGRGFPQYSIKNKIDITSELVRLIGYYLAEGNLENRVRVCFNLGLPPWGHEKSIIDDIIYSSKKVFNYLPKIYQDSNGTRVTIDNAVVYGLFAKVLGFENRNSLTKELPDLVFTLPQHFKMELLRAFFLGDGSVDTEGRNIRFCSSSKKLIAGISYLLSQMGIIYSLVEENPSKENKSIEYKVVISNKADLEKLKVVWERHWKAGNIKTFCQHKKTSTYKIQKFNNLIFLPIKEIKKISSTSKFVYDFSVIGETFIAGMGGVCCHNSHNPPQYNGFKLVREEAIPISGKSGIEEIKNLVLRGNFKEKNKGEIIKKKVLKEYIEFNLKDFNLKAIKPLKIVIDTANAVPGIVVPEIFKKTNCKIYHLFAELNGSFPNHLPIPHEEENLRDLKREVLEKRADLGIAFDGDGDRIIFVDENGKMIPGDLITALLTKLILQENPGEKVLCDVRSSNIVRDVVVETGGIPVMGKIGHSFIKERMRKENIIFQGELNGHYYLREHYFSEAPFFVIFKILEEMSKSGKTISELVKPYQKYFHSGEINFEVRNKKKVLKTLEDKFIKGGKVIKIDGLRIDFPDWWFNARPSHTEPVLRLVVEAKTKKLMEKKKKELISLLKGAKLLL